MKTINDENGVIHYKYNVLDRIYFWILRKTVWKFKKWLEYSPFYKKWYYSFLRKLPVFKHIEPFEMNSFDEASINLNRSIRHEAIRKQLINKKEEMGEAELFKYLKKKLRKKDYKRYMASINKWKEKGKW